MQRADVLEAGQRQWRVASDRNRQGIGEVVLPPSGSATKSAGLGDARAAGGERLRLQGAQVHGFRGVLNIQAHHALVSIRICRLARRGPGTCPPCPALGQSKAGSSRETDQAGDAYHDIFQGLCRNPAEWRCPAGPPIQASGLVAKNDPGDPVARRHGHFERVPFDLAGNGTNDGQFSLAVVCFRGEHQGRTPARLLMSSLRAEVQPN